MLNEGFWVYLADRMGQPSFWAGLGLFVTGSGLKIAPEYWQDVTMIGMCLSGALAMFLKSRPATGTVTPATLAPELKQ